MIPTVITTGAGAAEITRPHMSRNIGWNNYYSVVVDRCYGHLDPHGNHSCHHPHTDHVHIYTIRRLHTYINNTIFIQTILLQT